MNDDTINELIKEDERRRKDALVDASLPVSINEQDAKITSLAAIRKFIFH